MPTRPNSIQEEIDRQNRYAGRAVAYVVGLNGLAAIVLMTGLLHGTLSAERASSFADAMMVFGIGAAAGLAAALFGYLRRAVHIEQPDQMTQRRVFAWLGAVAAIVGAGCFIGALSVIWVAWQ